MEGVAKIEIRVLIQKYRDKSAGLKSDLQSVKQLLSLSGKSASCKSKLQNDYEDCSQER